jgi:aspartate 1-decarboxylase
MLRQILKVKIHNAVVTDAVLNYSGSITLDPALVKAAGLLENEWVQVLNLSTGARFDTFVIKGKRNTGKVCLNGPAARLGQPGDKIHILSWALVDNSEISGFKTRFILMNEKNAVVRIKEVRPR